LKRIISTKVRRVVYHANKYWKGNVISRLTISRKGRKLRFQIFVNAVLPKFLGYAALAAPTYASWSIDADAYYENYRLLTEPERRNG
jgi:hypothetical protein